MKKLLRYLSLITLILGFIFLIDSNYTGAFIGVSNLSSILNNTIGTSLILISSIIFMVSENTGENVEDITSRLHKLIEEEKKHHKANPKYIKGLSDIEEIIERDKIKYESAKDTGLKKNIFKRLTRWEEALGRRHKYFFELPHHVPDVIDLPERGLYDYRPMGGKKSKYIELSVTHYTDQRRFKQIKKAYEERKRGLIFYPDESGWSYFTSHPLPERLKTKKLRYILGTGLQDYVPFPKSEVRNPESLIMLKIRIPKERILVKTENYQLGSGERVKVKKYAIAGGISYKDTISTPEGGRYLNLGLEEGYAKKEKWKSTKK